eukprot:TRINITY_DN25068_c0_g1_i1.p1 TRINITY_DN25068_c0_g1~~TRINITY_DN25068_c0_g1_i1.p1  ORF type:complete len:189 (+),score=37.95 TRINITY_DN25068_c0_g1_i1:67-633(+)
MSTALWESPRSRCSTDDALSNAEAGDVRGCMNILKEANFADVNAKDENGWTILIWATMPGFEHEFESILNLQEFTEFNWQDKKGCTALHWAAHYGNTAACRRLAEHPKFFEIDARDNWGYTAAEDAARKGHPKAYAAINAAFGDRITMIRRQRQQDRPKTVADIPTEKEESPEALEADSAEKTEKSSD